MTNSIEQQALTEAAADAALRRGDPIVELGDAQPRW